MNFTSPKTWVVTRMRPGIETTRYVESLATDLNTYLRDNLNYLYRTQPYVFSLAGVMPAAGVSSAPYPVLTFASRSVVLVSASLGTVDSVNPVTVDFLINGVQFTSLAIPTAVTWAAATSYLVGSCIVGATGYSACATVAGTSGSTTPAFYPSEGATVLDGSVTWQTVGLGFNSAPAVTGTWILPGNADDYLSATVGTYGGSTAANLTATVRVQ